MTTMQNSTRYRVAGLGVEFDDGGEPKRVLADLNFSVGRSEFVAICGPSGTGKTTILRALAGLVPTVAGSSVEYERERVSGPPDDVVVVFQNYAASLLPWRSVARNVALGLEGRMPRDQVRQRIAEVLELVGLGDRDSSYPWQLSGGMQQRVQIARALATQPRVLLMDEPFGALDDMTKQSMQDEMQRLQAVSGPTVVFVTHDIDEAVYLSDRVLVINGSPATVTHSIPVQLERPRNQITTKEMPEYLALRHRVYEAIHGA